MTQQNKSSNEKTQELHNDYLTEFIFNIFKKSYIEVLKNHSSIQIPWEEIYLKVMSILSDIKEHGENNPDKFLSLWNDIYMEMRMTYSNSDEDAKFLTTYILLFVCQVINTSSKECYSHTMEYVVLTKICENYPEYKQIHEFLDRYFENLPKEHEAWFDNYCSQDDRAEKITSLFSDNNFFTLPKVESLSNTKKNKIIMAISDRPIPFKVAMLHVLGYLNYLDENMATKREKFALLEKAFGLKCGDRTLKGNINSLYERSKENSCKYSANANIQLANDFLKAL